MSDEEKTEKTKGKTAAQIAKILERGTKILELRKNGASLRAISATLKKQAEEKGESTRGYSYEQVRKDYWNMVNLRIDEQQDAVDEIRILCAERLDDVFLNVMPLLRNADPEIKIKASTSVTRVVKEYAELFGAKRPQKLEVTGKDGAQLFPKDVSLTINAIYGDGDTSDSGDK